MSTSMQSGDSFKLVAAAFTLDTYTLLHVPGMVQAGKPQPCGQHPGFLKRTALRYIMSQYLRYH
jgi:hypothetical protein